MMYFGAFFWGFFDLPGQRRHGRADEDAGAHEKRGDRLSVSTKTSDFGETKMQFYTPIKDTFM